MISYSNALERPVKTISRRYFGYTKTVSILSHMIKVRLGIRLSVVVSRSCARFLLVPANTALLILYRYATVRDSLKPATETDVCGGWRRQSHVMTSYSHELQVNFIGSLVDERLPNFLLQYQGARGTETAFLYTYLPASRAKPARSFSGFHMCFCEPNFGLRGRTKTLGNAVQEVQEQILKASGGI